MRCRKRASSSTARKRPCHAFARERFDVARSIANDENALGCDARTTTGQERRTAPARAFECGYIEHRLAEHVVRTESDVFRSAQQTRVNRCRDIGFARRELHSADVSTIDDAHTNFAGRALHGTGGKNRAEAHVAALCDTPCETIDLIKCVSREAIRNDDCRSAHFEALIAACEFKRAIWSNARGGRETNVDTRRLRFFDERCVEYFARNRNTCGARDAKFARAARHTHGSQWSCRCERACCAERMNRCDAFICEARATNFRAWKLRTIDEQNARARACSRNRSGRTRGSSADHGDIELERR